MAISGKGLAAEPRPLRARDPAVQELKRCRHEAFTASNEWARQRQRELDADADPLPSWEDFTEALREQLAEVRRRRAEHPNRVLVLGRHQLHAFRGLRRAHGAVRPTARPRRVHRRAAARRAARNGDSGGTDPPDDDDAELDLPDGAGPGPTHVAVILRRYLAELRERAG